MTDPEEKRKIIGREFIRAFEKVQLDLVAEAKASGGAPVKFLVQGTLYPDVVESGGGAGTANIKSHHNVGGLPDDLDFELIERCAPCSRTRSARSVASSASPRRSSDASRFRGPASVSGSSVRSPLTVSRFCVRPTPSPARS